MAILAVLASAVIPMAEMSATRSKELELRRALRDIRTAIDAYKDDFDRAVAEKKIIPAISETGYPKELEELVEGNDWKGLYPYKRKYLRRIPQDPFDEFDEGWGTRSYRDDPDSTFSSGEDIYDVFSQSTRYALDGTPYNTW
ncbi:MAG: type II secretion system protein [Deltaproteobacteria bacterium]|jgi:general secretion pathway protein G|nr:type II secretion system protein [Deltaproteobacteria bacterium]